MSLATLLRSTSLAEDLAHPERLSHYHPTRRAMPIVSAVARPGAATMVIAPYGTGKSIAAGIGALAVRNDAADRAALAPVLERMAAVDPGAAAALGDRLSAGTKGMVVALSGLVTDPLHAIAGALGMAQPPRSVEGFGRAMRECGWDHVAIVWDEFGRHLEGLVADGRSSELDAVQRLAERTARADTPTISLTLLLHQNLLAYATRLNETSRTEWRKIEGRFAPLRVMEDSQEYFALVAEVIAGLRPPLQPSLDETTVEQVIAARWLDGLDDAGRVRHILEDARPLTAGALQVLPTLVARVGQNERTLFSFLRERDLSGRVGIEEVYSSFADAMRTDVGIGGTYRRWVETESARSRADTPLKRELLAAACLLQLGAAGERRRLPRVVVELAVRDGVWTAAEIAEAFDDLARARLLLWRKANDDVAVWHGADVDVAHRVREERDRRSGDFDLKAFLIDRFPAPHIRAPGHNARFGVNRHLAGRYATPAELQAGISCPPEEAGGIAYILAEDREALVASRAAAGRLADERLVAVVPERPLDVEGAALELVALEALRADKDFLASDPMVPTELDELHSVALGQLARLMRGLLDPGGSDATWYAHGRQLDVSAERPASVAASRLLNGWFDRTPRIANEQLMRAQASRTIQTARVRVVTAILERGDRLRLGYEPGDGSAEGSIYRTVLEKTGLRPADATRFANPDEIIDPGLAEVWSEIAAFFRLPTPDASQKPLSGLIDRLTAPPTGVPRAVLPILVAAGFRHFARAVAVYHGGAYVPDLLGFNFDGMVQQPEAYSVRVLDAAAPEVADYLAEVCYAFAHERPKLGEEVVRRAHDAIVGWLRTVPDGSRRSNRLGAYSRAMLRAISSSTDPIQLLMQDLPRALNRRRVGLPLVADIEGARIEIDHLRDAFAEEAVELVREAFASPGRKRGAIGAVKAWADCFDLAELDRRAALRIIERSVLGKAVETANGRFSEKSLANALSSILLQRSLDKWDDRTPAQFRTALREVRGRIEGAALDTTAPSPSLRPVIEARMAELNDMLAKLDEVENSRTIDQKVAGSGR